MKYEDLTKEKFEEMQNRIRIYQNVLHSLHSARAISLREDIVIHILNLISSWSYAHRVGNGQSDNVKLVSEALDKLSNWHLSLEASKNKSSE